MVTDTRTDRLKHIQLYIVRFHVLLYTNYICRFGSIFQEFVKVSSIIHMVVLELKHTYLPFKSLL